MSASQRRKGANGELELCAILSEQLGVVVKRKLGQARDSGHDIDLPPYRIECKRRKRIAGLYEWIKQACVVYHRENLTVGLDPICRIEHETMNSIPIVALRADGKDWLVVLRLNDFITLAREEISK